MKLKLIVKMNIDKHNKIDNIILDTAAEMNIISLDLIRNLGIIEDIKKTEELILPLGGNHIVNHGKIKLIINGINIVFFVVDKITNKENIQIGWPSLLKAGFSLSCINGECVVKLNGVGVEVVSYKSENKLKCQI